MLSYYSQVLGVPENAGLQQLKKAYRLKAMQYHPDRNKEPGAHEQFILLSEAYEYLLLHRQGRAAHRAAPVNEQQWADTAREEARERARRHARMEYEKYVRSPEFKALSAMETIMEHITLTMAYLVAGAFPFFGAHLLGAGFKASLITGLVCLVPITWFYLKRTGFNPGRLGSSFLVVAKTNTFRFIALTLLNLFMLRLFTLVTLLPVDMLVWLFLLLTTIVYVLCRWVIRMPRQRVFILSFAVAPLFINMFFLLNFAFASGHYEETYRFYKQQTVYRGMVRNTRNILLEDNVFQEYPGIRLYMDYQGVPRGNHITYVFKDGLFGLRVMDSYIMERRKIPYNSAYE